MNPTLDWLKGAEKHIRLTLEQIRPKLLETQGNIEHELKDDKTAVTEMDMLVENRLQRALQQYDKSVAFCGEETGASYDKPTLWLVDPIDGTEPFIRGLPFATNMIALIDDGQPIMGIVYNFVLGDYYLAIKGQGATCNGHQIYVSNRPLDRAYVSVGRADPALGLADYVRTRMKGGASVNMGATGYILAAIASGAVEARVNFRSAGKPWDLAAGALLIQEAGGRVENIGTGAYDYRQADLVAANPVTFDELMRFMNDFVASHQ